MIVRVDPATEIQIAVWENVHKTSPELAKQVLDAYDILDGKSDGKYFDRAINFGSPSETTSNNSPTAGGSSATPNLDALGNQFGIKTKILEMHNGDRAKAEEWLTNWMNRHNQDNWFDGLTKDANGNEAILYGSEFDQLHREVFGDKWVEHNHVERSGDPGTRSTPAANNPAPGGSNAAPVGSNSGRSAEDILNDSLTWRNLGNQNGIKDAIQKRFGGANGVIDTAEEAERAVDFVNHYARNDNIIDGYNSKGEVDGTDTEAWRLQADLGIRDGMDQKEREKFHRNEYETYEPTINGSAQGILDSSAVWRNLGNQNGIKDAIQKKFGGANGVIDTPEEAREAVAYIEQFAGTNGVVDGYKSDGTISNNRTEAYKLQRDLGINYGMPREGR